MTPFKKLHQGLARQGLAPEAIADAPRGGSYLNPIIPHDGPDPFVARGEDGWIMVTTGMAVTGTFPMYHSSDLVHWEPSGSLFRRGEPAWAVGDHWAPEIHRVGDGWVAWFTGRDPTGRLCVGAATATRARGPYRHLDAPLIRDARVGMIDATLLCDGGRLYLYWKEDGNDIGERCRILAATLSDDGLALTGTPTVVLESDPTSWEGTVAEAPQMVKRGGHYYLFYSGNRYASAAYAEGVARSTSPLGPFLKHPTPILRSSEAWKGPGHACLVSDVGGTDWLVYHAWRRGRIGRSPGRVVLLDPVTWTDGWPQVSNSRPSSGRIEAPRAAG